MEWQYDGMGVEEVRWWGGDGEFSNTTADCEVEGKYTAVLT